MILKILIGVEVDVIDTYFFNEIEKKIKDRINKGLNIINKTEAEENVRTSRTYFFDHMIFLNKKKRCKNLLQLLNYFFYVETIGKMLSENIFSYESQEEQNNAFNSTYNELLGGLKTKRNNKIYHFLLININLSDSDKTRKENNKAHKNDDWEEELKNKLRNDWNFYLIDCGIICPIKYSCFPVLKKDKKK